jgi:hypothetical protein
MVDVRPAVCQIRIGIGDRGTANFSTTMISGPATANHTL